MKSASAIRRQVRALGKMQVSLETERLAIIHALDWVLSTAGTAPPAVWLAEMEEMANLGRKALARLERRAK